MKRLLSLGLLSLTISAAPADDYSNPYRVLQTANRTFDAELAASAYAADGVLIFEYGGGRMEEFQGRDAIRQSYVKTFGQLDASTPPELEFRFNPAGPQRDVQTGLYRIAAKVGGRSITTCGRFAVRLRKENGRWLFAEDRGSIASAADFHALARSPL